ncbi:DUF456 domain-containing protein [Lacinutrix sp. Hel_I_90]|uniref:DUF456 domain-containing protein n=1 Tax=Lacinutrix sp. Hel_I_90 TaxID=1249999 RepID=UPI0005CB117A|nr:DUF456 domain-containing protein [Lacinutrix sp. Hel_I_90]
MIYNRLQEQDGSSSSGGFFGKLWRGIKDNIGSIVGLLIGGPVGLLLGAFLDAVINAGGTVTTRGGEIYIDEDGEPDQYPLNEIEEGLINEFVENELKPTLIALANKVDLTVNFNRGFSQKGSNIIETVNSVLKDISVIKSFAVTLQNFARSRSSNFYKNKVALIELYFNALEKAVIKTIEDDQTLQYKLVLEPQLVSNISNVESIVTRWQKQTVTANIKKYKAKDAIVTNQETEVVIGNTDVLDTTPVLQDQYDEVANAIDANPKSNFLRNLGFATIAALIIKKI